LNQTSAMKSIKIYLRAVVVKEKNELMMFDTDRNGAINDLITIAHPGQLIIWKLDTCSGISKLLNIKPKDNAGNIFRKEPKRGWFNSICIKIPKDAKPGDEMYGIECQLHDKTKIYIDPLIRIPPPSPPPHG